MLPIMVFSTGFEDPVWTVVRPFDRLVEAVGSVMTGTRLAIFMVASKESVPGVTVAPEELMYWSVFWASWAMLACVAVFGLATVVFGLSHNLVLSLVALAVVGASDMVSVVVRQTLVQVATPSAMRGRVSAVNQVFIGASNELGEFESGVTAAWFGPRLATVLGGVGTCVVVLTWALLFPALYRADSLDGKQSSS